MIKTFIYQHKVVSVRNLYRLNVKLAFLMTLSIHKPVIAPVFNISLYYKVFQLFFLNRSEKAILFVKRSECKLHTAIYVAN